MFVVETGEGRILLKRGLAVMVAVTWSGTRNTIPTLV